MNRTFGRFAVGLWDQAVRGWQAIRTTRIAIAAWIANGESLPLILEQDWSSVEHGMAVSPCVIGGWKQECVASSQRRCTSRRASRVLLRRSATGRVELDGLSRPGSWREAIGTIPVKNGDCKQVDGQSTQALIQRRQRLTYILELRLSKPIIVSWSAPQPEANDSAVAQPKTAFSSRLVLAPHLTGDTSAGHITWKGSTQCKNVACRAAPELRLSRRNKPAASVVSVFLTDTADTLMVVDPHAAEQATIRPNGRDSSRLIRDMIRSGLRHCHEKTPRSGAGCTPQCDLASRIIDSMGGRGQPFFLFFLLVVLVPAFVGLLAHFCCSRRLGRDRAAEGRRPAPLPSA